MLLRFLESLGVSFDMDWDEEVTITVPGAVSCVELEQALKPFGKQLSQEVRYRAKRQRSVFVGGQLNGREVSWQGPGRRGCGHRMAGGGYAYWIRHRLKRGCWEVYEEVLDGRAFFRGYTTSERKARHGEITEQARR
jgi:hypothetical protein